MTQSPHMRINAYCFNAINKSGCPLCNQTHPRCFTEKKVALFISSVRRAGVGGVVELDRNGRPLSEPEEKVLVCCHLAAL